MHGYHKRYQNNFIQFGKLVIMKGFFFFFLVGTVGGVVNICVLVRDTNEATLNIKFSLWLLGHWGAEIFYTKEPHG